MHSAELRSQAERQQRLDVLAAWREVPVFSEQETAALAWAEALTNIIDKHVEDDVYNQVSAIFNEKDIVVLTTVVLEINSWNRIVKAFHFIPELTE